MNARSDRCPSDRLDDARVAVAHRRQVACRADVGHRKLRPCRFLHDRPEDDARRRVVELDVWRIGDNADHFDVSPIGSGDPDTLADLVAPREHRARQGRRDQRDRGFSRAVVP
jgi:hypothetical protein